MNTIDENANSILSSVCEAVKREFKEQKYILSYREFLDIFSKNPRKLVRNSAQYMCDMFCYFGVSNGSSDVNASQRSFHLFKQSQGKHKPPIIGQEEAHLSIYRVLEQFVRQGKIDKLILLHGPNGSGKSSTTAAIASALEEYSKTEEGAVYRFNWIFPTDKIGYEGLGEASFGKHIGFEGSPTKSRGNESFAHLEDEEIMCKVVGEMKENPIFILPEKERDEIFQKVCVKNGLETEVSTYLKEGALSFKNKKIFDSLLVAYKGDLEKVLRHVQVERFFYSGRYRVGIACVEPQMAIDAQDRQLNIERNIQNLPPVLQNIRLFEPQGELIDANRGFIEFSDLLKRPLEAFKYLITTIEKMSINLTSGMTDLDLIMMASTNEKHLDAFKNTADWPSFKGRFELVRVPYLLSVVKESEIYKEDIKIIEKSRPVGPHALTLLATWAVLTRLRQPDPDFYGASLRPLIAKLDPYDKLALYDGRDPSPIFSDIEKSTLKKNVEDIFKESQTSAAYEGRFGASPREMKMLFYFASQNSQHDCVSALALFDEIEKLTRDRSVYDYLQFEPRGHYHDFKEFLKYIKAQYAREFHKEFLSALHFYEEEQYVRAIQKYMKHVTSFLNKEKIQNEITGRHEEANESFMDELEALMGITGSKREARERLVSKLASWRLENPSGVLDFSKVFGQELAEISRQIYLNKETEIKKIKSGMIMFGSEDYQKLPRELYDVCERTFENLEKKHRYTKKNAWASLSFLNSISDQTKIITQP